MLYLHSCESIVFSHSLSQQSFNGMLINIYSDAKAFLVFIYQNGYNIYSPNVIWRAEENITFILSLAQAVCGTWDSVGGLFL